MALENVLGFEIESFCCIPIVGFQGEYRFLSNFYIGNLEYDGDKYPSAEHAYQAAKGLHPIDKQVIRDAVDEQTGEPSPGRANGMGRRVSIRPDWENVKVEKMWAVVCVKFEVGSELAFKLLETGHAHLIEGNRWHDNFWGVCECPRCTSANPPLGQGQNVLGKLLMARRQQLRDVNLASR